MYDLGAEGQCIEPHKGHRWSKEAHPATVTPVLHQQTSVETLRKNLGFSKGIGSITRTREFFQVEIHISLIFTTGETRPLI